MRAYHAMVGSEEYSREQQIQPFFPDVELPSADLNPRVSKSNQN